jgi:hypothetical protein
VRLVMRDQLGGFDLSVPPNSTLVQLLPFYSHTKSPFTTNQFTQTQPKKISSINSEPTDLRFFTIASHRSPAINATTNLNLINTQQNDSLAQDGDRHRGNACPSTCARSPDWHRAECTGAA